jgi:hypothetical protein
MEVQPKPQTTRRPKIPNWGPHASTTPTLIPARRSGWHGPYNLAKLSRGDGLLPLGGMGYCH